VKTIEGMIYSALAECYKEPTLEFARDVAAGRVYEMIAEGAMGLNIPVSPDVLKPLDRNGGEGRVKEIYHGLKDEYYSLFNPLYVVPVESVYKEWKDGSGGKGYIMGDPAIEMKKRYEMAGIEIPLMYKDMPDHISLLLEYASLLCENLPMEMRSTFIMNHLDWLEDLREDVYKYSGSEFYRSVVDVTLAFVRYERSYFGSLKEVEYGK